MLHDTVPMATVTTRTAHLAPALYDAAAAEIRERADDAHRQYPQYAGHWDDSKWVLVRIERTIKTKLGVAFTAGELTLAYAERNSALDISCGAPEISVMAYSTRNGITTAVGRKPARDVTLILTD